MNSSPEILQGGIGLAEGQVLVEDLRRQPGKRLGLMAVVGCGGNRLHFIQISRLRFVPDFKRGGEWKGGELRSCFSISSQDCKLPLPDHKSFFFFFRKKMLK